MKLMAEIDASENNEAIMKRLKQLITDNYRRKAYIKVFKIRGILISRIFLNRAKISDKVLCNVKGDSTCDVTLKQLAQNNVV